MLCQEGSQPPIPQGCIVQQKVPFFVSFFLAFFVGGTNENLKLLVKIVLDFYGKKSKKLVTDCSDTLFLSYIAKDNKNWHGRCAIQSITYLFLFPFDFFLCK